MSHHPRPPRRHYPLTSYVPFAIMVAIPVLLIAFAVFLVSHFIAHGSPPAPATPTATVATSTPRATGAAVQGASTRTVTPGTAPISTTLGATPTATSPAAIAPVAAVIVAAHSSADGTPVGAATVFHGGPITLWCFATLPRVAAGDTLRYAWRDLTRHTLVVDWFKPIAAAAAPYHARMFAYIGNTPSTPFPPGSYRVDIYRGPLLAASGTFRVAAS